MIGVLQLICPTGYYGAERWVTMLARNIDSRRVRTELAVTRDPGQPEPEIVRHFPGHTEVIETSGRFDTRTVGALRRLVRERDIDIIHTHGYKSDVLGLAAARLAGAACVATPHGYGEAAKMSFKRRLYHRIGAQALRRCDAVVPLSEALCAETLELGVKRSRLHYVCNGVDLSEVDDVLAMPAPASRSDVRTIGYVGQLIPRKRVHLVLETFDVLHRKHPDTKLVLLGDGPERTRLEALADTLDAKSAIRFEGFRSDRLEAMRTFDLFVLASSEEGIPRVGMEAMALGIPSVAFEIPGLDVLFGEERGGVLVPDGDTDAYLAAWERVLDDPSVASALGTQARRTVESEFSAEAVARSYASLFERFATSSATR